MRRTWSTSLLAEANQDADVIARIRAGDRDAFDAVYRTSYAAVWRFIVRLTHSSDLASDIVHDIFLAIWMNRATWTPRSSIREYLFRAARNEAVQWQTRQHARDRAVRIRTDTLAPSASPNADHYAESDDLGDRVRRAVDALPPRQREAFLLRWNDDLTASEIGRVLGISATAATNLLTKAQDKLKQVIRD